MNARNRTMDALRKLEASPLAARVAAALDPLADAVRRARPLDEALRGARTGGHPVHPALVHLPIGLSAATSLLDVAPGGRASTLVLNAAAVAAAAPTALTGIAEWGARRTRHRQRAVGAVHAAVATLGTALNVGALACRATGRQRTGAALGLAAAASYSAAGFLGGDLAYGEEGFGGPAVEVQEQLRRPEHGGAPSGAAIAGDRA